MSERALAIEIVRGWGLKFDGTGDPKEFVGRIEDRAASYGIRLEHIAGAMKFLLKGNALSWWHANANQMTQWNTFKRQLSLHFVPDKRSGQHPRSERGNLKRPWDTNQQRGGDLTTCSNKGLTTRPGQKRPERPPMKKPQLLADGGTRQHEDVTDIHAEDSWEEDHTDCSGLQENNMELQPEGSWGKDHEVSLTNPSEETTEIPLAIQQEARWRQAQKRPGQQLCFEMSAEGKDYRVKISQSEDINICQLKPDGGTPEQEEDHEVPLTSPWEEATEIPLVIQQEARWRQSHSRPGQQVCYKRSVEGKEYRVKINRGGYVNICQLKQEHVIEDQAEPQPTIRPQLLTDRGTQQQEDLIDTYAEESWEEDRGVRLTNQWEEATEIPLVIQQEARLRQSHSRPGQQVCYKRSVEGKEYRVKINRGGYVNIYQQTPEQLREPPPRLEPQIPLVIQQEARWRQTQKRRGQQVCFKRSVEGKEYRVKISRSGNLSIEQL